MGYAAISGEREHHAGIGGLEEHLAHELGWRNELLTMLNKPQCQTQSITTVIKNRPPLGPQESVKICNTGIGLCLTVSKSWIEKSRQRSKRKPMMKEAPTADNRETGATFTACLVSSARWAEASNPRRVYCENRTPQTATYAAIEIL